MKFYIENETPNVQKFQLGADVRIFCLFYLILKPFGWMTVHNKVYFVFKRTITIIYYAGIFYLC